MALKPGARSIKSTNLMKQLEASSTQRTQQFNSSTHSSNLETSKNPCQEPEPSKTELDSNSKQEKLSHDI